MSAPHGRSAVGFVLRAFFSFLTLAAFPIFTPYSANAVIVRGTVTDPLGKPVGGARVQLVEGPTAVAFALSGPDGT